MSTDDYYNGMYDGSLGWNGFKRTVEPPTVYLTAAQVLSVIGGAVGFSELCHLPADRCAYCGTIAANPATNCRNCGAPA